MTRGGGANRWGCAREALVRSPGRSCGLGGRLGAGILASWARPAIVKMPALPCDNVPRGCDNAHPNGGEGNRMSVERPEAGGPEQPSPDAAVPPEPEVVAPSSAEPTLPQHTSSRPGPAWGGRWAE